jgi:MarR family transcriptional regulator for hemolysin
VNEFLALFTRAAKVMRSAADEAMSRHGVRVGQNLVLELLWERDGLTPGELAERLRIAKPTAVKSAIRMEAAGLVRRQRDHDDRRLVRLYLTEHARTIRAAIEAERGELERRALKSLSRQERESLLRALTKIVREFGDEARRSDLV